MEELQVPDKLNSIDSLMFANDLLTQKKLELQNLQHNITLAKTSLVSLQESMVRQRNDFDHKLLVDKQKFEQDKNKKWNEFLQREDNISKGEQNLIKRIKEVESREKAVVVLEEERKKLVNDRIEVEHLKNQALEENKKAQILISEATNKLNNANIKNKEADVKLNEVNSKLALVNKLESEINKKTKDFTIREKNLEEVRKIIEPKLEEGKKLEEQNKKDLEEISKQKSELNLLKEKNEKLISDLDGKTKFIISKQSEYADKDLKIKELTRKIELLEAKK